MVITFSLILLLLVFLLYTPVYIEIDSTQRLFQVRIWAIGGARLIVHESQLGIRLNILGWKKNILFGRTQKPKQAEKKRSLKLKKSTLKKMSRKAGSLLRSFKVTNFYLNIDTDDYAMNALLYPIAIMLSRPNRQIRFNFRGEVELRLKIENSLQRMLRAYIR